MKKIRILVKRDIIDNITKKAEAQAKKRVKKLDITEEQRSDLLHDMTYEIRVEMILASIKVVD